MIPCVAPTLQGTADGAVPSWTRVTGAIDVFFFDGMTVQVVPDVLGNIFDSTSNPPPPWPGPYGAAVSISVPKKGYLAMEFTVPPGFLASYGDQKIYGGYNVGESGGTIGVGYSMSISRACGDFSDPASPGSTVLPGCRKNLPGADAGVTWSNFASGAACELEDGATYYLNIIFADIDGLTPNGGGMAKSTYSDKCEHAYCNAAFVQAPGTWFK